MLPTLRQLQYLKLLAEHGSFSRAAEAAHVTQPTLSAGVQELERILGAPVVDRGRAGRDPDRRRRGGRCAAPPSILAQAEDLVEAARSAGQPLSGRFRLGVIPTVAPFLLPRALPLLRERFPKLRLFLREDLTHRLIAALKAGALDAALIALPYDMTGLDWAHVADDELLAALPANHPLAAERRVAPERLDERGPDPAGGRPLPARARAGRLRPGAAAAARRATRPLRRHLAADPGADGRLGPRRLLPAGDGGGRRPGRRRRGRGAPARRRATRRARSSSPGAPAPAAPPRAACWPRC